MKIKSNIESIDDIELDLIKEGKLKKSHKEGYINNKELYQEYVNYCTKKRNWIEQGLGVPPLSEKIGSAIIQIATRRCNSRAYNGYTNNWKEELIANAIMTATIRGHNFDPERSENPFAYLTQICDNAIKEQLKREKRQLYIRYKSMEESGGFVGSVDEENLDETSLQSFTEHNQATEDRRKYIQDYEDRNLSGKVDDDGLEDESASGVMQFIGE